MGGEDVLAHDKNPERTALQGTKALLRSVQCHTVVSRLIHFADLGISKAGL